MASLVERLRQFNVGNIQSLSKEAADEIERLRAGIKAIQDGTVSGKVGGEDVVWFDQITTLYDFCDQLIGDEQLEQGGADALDTAPGR